MAYARLKRAVAAGLVRPDWQEYLDELLEIPARQVINPLFGLLHNTRAELRWHAVTAFGRVTAHLADKNRESARVIIRRLLWNLNDESGGIGWGSPEAMGECLARHAGLAKEYGRLLISYSQPGKTQLEHDHLQVGVMWAMARLAQNQPEFYQPPLPDLTAYLAHPMTALRGHAAWVTGLLKISLPKPLLETLSNDAATCEIYVNQEFQTRSVQDLLSPAWF